MTKRFKFALALVLAAAVAAPSAVRAQDAPAAAEPAAEEAAAPAFSAEQLEQMVAPVALYPDALLMQVLMGATYPLEIVEADRWLKKNPNLKGDDLTKAAAAEGWDVSVQSLTHFPQVVERMSDNLDWTRDVGDAFLAQQADVLAAVQVMRNRAYEEGNLKTSKEQQVVVENAASDAATTVVVEQPKQVIKIVPADPQVVYVPTYSSTVVYGAPPATVYYPSVYTYPPNYVATSVLSFGIGMAVGAALWSDCDWHGYGVYGCRNCGGWYGGGNYHGGNYHGGNTNININGDVNIGSGNVGSGNRPGLGGAGGLRPSDRPQWKHDASHRRGVSYRDNKVASQYTRPGTTRPSTSDRGYGRPSATTRPAPGIAPSTRPSTRPSTTGPSTRPSTGAIGSGKPAGTRPSTGGIGSGSRPAGVDRPSTRPSGGGDKAVSGARPSTGGASGLKPSSPSARPSGSGSSLNRPSSGTRPSPSSGSRQSAFSSRGGSADRAYSSRGSSSRGGSGGGSSRGSFGGGGGSRGGGGGMGGGSRGGRR